MDVDIEKKVDVIFIVEVQVNGEVFFFQLDDVQ